MNVTKKIRLLPFDITIFVYEDCLYSAIYLDDEVLIPTPLFAALEDLIFYVFDKLHIEIV